MRISGQVAADLNWFKQYLHVFNGISMFKQNSPSKEIFADACETGFGAFDDMQAYKLQISKKLQKLSSTQLECLNTLLALRTFISPDLIGKTVLISCDNMPTIFAYAHGRARDKVLAACARAAWFLASSLDVRIIYKHVPGTEMYEADALSRAHLQPKFQLIVEELLIKRSLTLIKPDPKDLRYENFM